ncbi:MAG: hypothetical protein M1837_004002 [Sclerophora amabilis]|nr:MAG: hypothetical protein M1837_004002 [Sclerophora amabilis]
MGVATTKSGVNVQDHAVVYMQGTTPYLLENEGPLSKDPLEIIPKTPEERLDPLSRINFGKVYTVEHNVKVREVGKIAPNSMPKLKAFAPLRPDN